MSNLIEAPKNLTPQQEIDGLLEMQSILGLQVKRVLLSVLQEKISVLPAITNNGYAFGYGAELGQDHWGNPRRIDARAIMLRSEVQINGNRDHQLILDYTGIHRIPIKFKNNSGRYDYSSPTEIQPHEYLAYGQESLTAIQKHEPDLASYLEIVTPDPTTAY